MRPAAGTTLSMTGALALGVLSCANPAATEPLPEAGSLEDFVEDAQPVLAARCASPTCHGSPERPLSLYAPRRYRLDPARTWVDEPLTEDELWHNYWQSAVFLEGIEHAPESLLLFLPLSARAGGAGHADTDVFLDTGDWDYRRLSAWIEAVLAG